MLLIALIIKTLRIDTGGSTDDPAVDNVADFQVPQDQIPPEILDRFSRLESELTGLGFESPVFHCIEDQLNFTTIYWMTFRHASGAALGRIHCRVWTKAHPPRFHLFPTFLSIFQDGSALLSSAGKPDTEAPPSIQMLRCEGKPAAELWRLHQGELAKTGKGVRPIVDDASLGTAIHDAHVLTRDFHLRRGAFRALRAEDLKARQLIGQTRSQFESSPNKEVHAEMELLQKAPSTWTNGLWLLVISVLAFIIAGGAQNSLETTLLLVPILLFHEMGHYLAMYIFKYRNLRMFFIPFFGAAVTGQNYNVASWKKVVVFLMGPLPGIALGVALGIAGIMRDNDLVIEAAFLCIFINGFNLLPLLPFDGGRVVGVILFSRHYILDFVFHVLAALGMILLGFALDSRILMFLGVFSLLAVRSSLHMAKVAELVRERNLSTQAVDGQSIPPETADFIITELKKKFPKGGTTKILAQRALTIFETLNSKPPAWPASLFFLGLHGAALLASFVGVGIIAAHQRGQLGDLEESESNLMPIEASGIKFHATKFSPALDSTNAVAIVATLNDRAQAAQLFENLIPDLPSTNEALLFGNTLYLRVLASDSTARAALFETCSKSTTNLFVERTNYWASFSFRVSIPNPESPLVKDLESYYSQRSTFNLIPPWCPDEMIGPSNRARFALARQTMGMIEDQKYPKDLAKKDEQDQKAMAKALTKGDTDEIARLQHGITNRAALWRKEHLARIKQLPDGQVDRQVIDNYMEYPDDTNALPAYQGSVAKLAERMGTLTKTTSEAWRYAALKGFQYSTENEIRMFMVQFADLPRGGVEFIRWLDSNGAGQIEYKVSGVLRNGDEWDDGADQN